MPPPTMKRPPLPGAALPPALGPLPAAPRKTFAITAPPTGGGQKVGIYGTGGIGKTSLASMAPGPVVYFDLDNSLGTLAIPGVQQCPVESYEDLRAALQSDIWTGVGTIVIDSLTACEEMIVRWTLANVPHEKGTVIKRIEDYGFGKGYQHVYDSFLPLLADLDAHVRTGRNVILIMHDCIANVPNPSGDDFLRYEPRLQSPGSGKGSIRHRTREWLDHLLFIGYDVSVSKQGGSTKGKASGSGTRTIYPVEMPHCIAKSRKLEDAFEYIAGDDQLWRALMPEKYNEEGK